MFVTGLCTAVLQSSLFGLFSMFPPLFSQSLMAGQGVAGVIASFAQIAVKAAFTGAVSNTSITHAAQPLE